MFKTILISLLALLACMSCSNAKSDLDLTQGTTSFLFPSQRLSCALGKQPIANDGSLPTNDILQKYFEFDNFTFSWKSTTQNLHIVIVKAEINDSRVTLSNPTISTLEIQNLIGSTYSGTTWKGIIDKAKDENTPNTKTVDCPLMFGGASVSNANDIDFEVQGTLTVIGVAYDLDASGNETGQGTPISTVTNFSLTNVAHTNTTTQ